VSRLALPNITLIAVATSWPGSRERYAETRRALDLSQRLAEFRNAVVFTDRSEPFYGVANLSVVPTPAWLTSMDAFAVYAIKYMPAWRSLFGSFTLLVHWDGFVTNPAAWREEFLSYDYIGAAWADGVVGNDGFNLRSMKMWNALCAAPIEATPSVCRPSDVCVCRTFRRHFELAGIRFAPAPVADRFAVECKPYAGSFGFHGLYVMPQIVALGLTG
jgi:uncharacterized protein DUF5672